jgi:AcrR family transcriptional regulator
MARARTITRARRRTATRRAATRSPRPDLLANEDLPPPPQQRRSVDNRERVKAAALRLFSRHGYARTSIDDIAAEADLATGGFYLHFRTKRQLLVALMDDLLHALDAIELELPSSAEPRRALRTLLARAFSTDLRFLGAYRAWQEAILTDAELARKHEDIHAWTTMRVLRLFRALEAWPGARSGVDVDGLAQVIDRFFWALLAEALRVPKVELDRWLDAATHIVFHAMFVDRRKE